MCSPGEAAEGHLPCDELKQGLGLCQEAEVDPLHPECCLPSCPGPGSAQSAIAGAGWGLGTLAKAWWVPGWAEQPQAEHGGKSCAGSVRASVICYILESS